MDTQHLIGLTLEQARRLVVVPRVIRASVVDGKPVSVSKEHKPSRINVEVNNGVIVSILGVG